MRYGKILVALAVFAPLLAACATSGGMTVSSGAVVNPVAKYRNAIAVRSVSGGQVMNVLTVPGVANEPFKAALESTLAYNGYLAQSGTPKFYLDAEIQNLDQPFSGWISVWWRTSPTRFQVPEHQRSIRSRPKAAQRSRTRRLPSTASASPTSARCGRI